MRTNTSNLQQKSGRVLDKRTFHALVSSNVFTPVKIRYKSILALTF
jgi:hypothetical protein